MARQQTGTPRAAIPPVRIELRTATKRPASRLGITHAIAGATGLAMIAAFWISTVVTELFGSVAAIIAVKSAIPWGFLLLVPALAATGGSGFRLARGRVGGKIDVKRKRMMAIAANGILILVPSAFFLAARVATGSFGTAFYVVQAIELVAGAINITLLGLNMRDGFAMTRRRRTRR